MQNEQGSKVICVIADSKIADGKIADVVMSDEDPIFLGILDQMAASGVMQGGCRGDQNF